MILLNAASFTLRGIRVFGQTWSTLLLQVLDLSAQYPVSGVAEMSDNEGAEGGDAPRLDASCAENTTDTIEEFDKVSLPNLSDMSLRSSVNGLPSVVHHRQAREW